jgi:hypothetical protein
MSLCIACAGGGSSCTAPAGPDWQLHSGERLLLPLVQRTVLQHDAPVLPRRIIRYGIGLELLELLELL